MVPEIQINPGNILHLIGKAEAENFIISDSLLYGKKIKESRNTPDQNPG
jgi:hypothetical protein